MVRFVTIALTGVDQIASWGYAIALFVVASQIGVDVVKVDPLTAAERFVEVCHPHAERARWLVVDVSLKAVAIGSILLIFVIVPIKISVLLFYKRIFTTRLFRRCIWVAVSVILAWGVASLVVCSNSCTNALYLNFHFTKDG